MTAALSIARSGLLASVAPLNAGAANIANGSTTGPLPASASVPDAAGGAPRVYQPSRWFCAAREVPGHRRA